MNSIDTGLLLLRVSVGVIVAVHGLNHAFGGGKLPGAARWFASLGMRQSKLQALLSAVTEVLAGVMLAAGLLTPLAAGAIVGVMTVAGVTAHRANGFFIFNEGYEYVLLIAMCAVVVGITGAGQASLDHAFGIHFSGVAGFGLSAGLGVVAAVVLLALSWRPAQRVGK